MGSKNTPDWTTQEMRDGWPQIPPEWWNEPGTHIVGLCVGSVGDSAVHGTRVRHAGETIIFLRPEQTQGEQFSTQRKKGASRGHWPTSHQPKSRKER